MFQAIALNDNGTKTNGSHSPLGTYEEACAWAEQQLNRNASLTKIGIFTCTAIASRVAVPITIQPYCGVAQPQPKLDIVEEKPAEPKPHFFDKKIQPKSPDTPEAEASRPYVTDFERTAKF